jgi:hypothetical protein
MVEKYDPPVPRCGMTSPMTVGAPRPPSANGGAEAYKPVVER